MPQVKEIEYVIAPPPPHMVGDGFRVHGFLPNQVIPADRMDPFLMMDYMGRFEFPAAITPKGVGPHPHRGLETVTLLYEGEISHGDNTGNSGTIKEGDVQWMTSGKGILHKEYHSQDFTEKGGVLHGVQLWVNLPAKDKMSAPKYQELLHANMTKLAIPNGGGVINIIAGEIDGNEGVAETFSPVHIYDIQYEAGAEIALNLPDNYNTCVLASEGEAAFNNQIVPENHVGLFKNEGSLIVINAKSKGRALVLSGEPLNEPIASQGPFVMNTSDEIKQAYHDYNTGVFGPLHGW